MAIERIIGIDFGTSTSVIRIKRYEDGKPVGEKLETKEVIFSGIGSTVPTLIQKKDDDESIVYYGYEAQQKRKKTTTYHSFKVDLESSDPEKRALARKLTEEFFCYLAKIYKAQSMDGYLGEPGDKECTIVSYPVKWSEETRQFMIEVARKAGFLDVTGMDEAQAAIRAVTVMSEDHLQKNCLLVNGKPSNILLIDMGAGTTDLVLCRYTPGAEAKAEILNTWPKDGEILFGGREVDSLLQGYFRNMMDEDSANLVFRRVGLDKFKTWKENTVSPALERNDSVTDFDPLDNQIEDNDIDMEEYCLDRASFEKCLEVYLKQLPKLINGCIDNSEIKASDVDLVIVTGGHSQWYFIQEMLAGKMPQYGKLELMKIMADPSRIISVARPQEAVALGIVYSIAQKRTPPILEEYEDTKPVPPKPPVALEYTPESEFELASDGENYIIKNYIGSRRVIRIPPVIRGRKVVAIGGAAFSRTWNKQRGFGIFATYYAEDYSTVECVHIPETITKIGRYAFAYCEKLHTVIAHQGIEEIAECAFADCTNLKQISFEEKNMLPGIVRFPPYLVSLGKLAFIRTALKEVILYPKTDWDKTKENRTFDSSCLIFYENN